MVDRRHAGFGRAAVLLLSYALVCPLLAVAQTASGTLTVTANLQGSIQLVFDNNASVGQAGYCPLVNAGTNNVTLDLGTASWPTGDSLPCVNFTRVGAPTYQVSSAFDVVVRKANTASASYRLAVSMSGVPPAGVTWLMNTLTLSTVPQTLQAANPYGRTTETLYVRVRNNVSAQVLTETINFVATAN